MKQLTDVEKLQRLIPHWIEHNQSHAAEFLRWAALTRASGEKQAAALLENAAALLQKTEAELSAALEKTGGATSPHDSESHHHHSHDA
jgi:hypothetical protein